MNSLVFYEKPGCIGNQRQKAELSAHGVAFEVKDLLSEIWTLRSLRPFFADMPIAQWFNSSAPRVKSGELDINNLTEMQAMALMIEDPLLIRRPLLQLGSVRQSGFGPGPVIDELQIALDSEIDLQSCPKQDDNSVCETRV